MEAVETIISLIAQAQDCRVERQPHPGAPAPGYALPEDLAYYLGHYRSIALFAGSEYCWEVVGLERFTRANPVIVGEDIADDISHNWFIIATNGRAHYITIDLAPARLGKCYDSFWDRHGVAGAQPVIANSFTELLQLLYANKGGYHYWLQDDFQSLGDAYEL